MKFISILLLSSLLISCGHETKTLVGIQPFNNFPPYISDSIASAVRVIYNFETIQLEKKPLPKSAFINIKSPRYRADSLLKY